MTTPTTDPRAAAADAVTWLFVPGDRPERFDKAAAAEPDEIILDLEDAVAPSAKEQARTQVCRWLADTGAGWVRINAVDTDWFDGDVAAVGAATGLRGVLVPKAQDVDTLARVRAALPDAAGVVALVETALGVADARPMAASPAVDRLAFGSIDFAVDLDAAEDDTSLLLARSTLVLASRAAGKPGPVDGVTRGFGDPDAVTADAERSRRLGFAGKMCIHPAQLAPVAAAFRPSADEVTWAQAVLEATAATGSGAISVGGQMIDKPVLDRARRILSRTRA